MKKFGIKTFIDIKKEDGDETFMVSIFKDERELGLLAGGQVLAYTCKTHALKVKSWFEQNTGTDYPDFIFDKINEKFQKT